MNSVFKYIGCFFDAGRLYETLEKYRTDPLLNTIARPHVTFEYMPEVVCRELFGKEVTVVVTGYGNNGKNEGVRVSLYSDDEGIKAMIEKIRVPHITLSVSEGAKAVNTADLEFYPVEPVSITGIFGGCARDNEIILWT